ncbi:uncharacterized protein LOC123564551 [Mercenaria mercenaria]|uniref:uncharacterized protein LOC123564551 n=1 Tax=Mercenaria mercenaria TaxID=6596 RepID=UPI00234F572C|nr:uncharacterized protein LOC123564551 [Mercenaria mercenaria]
MVATKASRKQFINSTLHFLRKRNFDGLDMDWEYPARRGGKPEDKANLVLLLGELKQAFEQESYHTGRPRLLLTAAVPAGKSNIDAGYDIPNVARSLDFINIMTYDLHGSWEAMTGHNSPLFGRASESADAAILNMEWAVKYWAQRGAPKHKLVVGIGLYGRSFKLQSPSNNGIGAPAVGAGLAGKYTREPGFMSYYEVCEELTKGATRVWQAEHRAPYIHKGDLWVGYDDEESVVAKVHYDFAVLRLKKESPYLDSELFWGHGVRWMKQNKYGGIMVWSLALDDFSGQFCNKGPYPLLKAINKELETVPKSPVGTIGKPSNSKALQQSSIHGKGHSISHSAPQGTGITLPVTIPDISQSHTGHAVPMDTLPLPTKTMIPPPPPIFQSNSGNSAAAQAIGDLLLQGTTKLSPPRSAKTPRQTGSGQPGAGNHQTNTLPVIISDHGSNALLQTNPLTHDIGASNRAHNDLFSTHLSHSQTPSDAVSGSNKHNMKHSGQDILFPGHAPTTNNEPLPPLFPADIAGSVLANMTNPNTHGTFPLEFMHNTGHTVGGGLNPPGDLIHDSVPTNSISKVPTDHVILPLPQDVPHISMVPPSTGDIFPAPVSDAAAVLPDTSIHSASGSHSHTSLPAATLSAVDGTLPGRHSVTGHSVVVGSLPVVEPVAAGIAAESIPSVSALGVSPTADIALPVAAAAHSDIGLASVRPAPPSRPRVNFSFSSSSSSNSSSSSSSSSSNSTERTRRIETSRSSLPPTVRDLLNQGPVDLLPLPADGNVHSLVDQTQGIIPGGTVEAVIPIDNINSLAQVLNNLQTSVPTSGTVLIPEPSNELRPETVLRQLDIGNILGSNIAAPVLIDRLPSQQSGPRTSRLAAGNTGGRALSQRIAANRANNLHQSNGGRTSQNTQRSMFIPPLNNRRAQRPQQRTQVSRRRVFPVSVTQLRRLISVLGRDTVRRLLQSGRLVLQPNVQRRQIVRAPVIRTRTPSLRNTMIRQRFPTGTSPNRNNLFSQFSQPRRINRRVNLNNNNLERTPSRASQSRSVNSNMDILSMLGL